jgi:hypothetical protein
MNPIQRCIQTLEVELRTADRRLDELELNAYRERLDGKIRLYLEIGALLRRKEQILRRLDGLKLAKAEVAITV